MKRTTLLFASLILLWSCDSTTTDSSTEAEQNEPEATTTLAQFVALDRAYIPPLFFTSVENIAASQASFAELQQEWTTFRSANVQLFPDTEWRAELEQIDQHLEKAATIIAGGGGLKKAHDELEHLREILLVARQRNDFDYFVDYLTAFHEPMEAIVLTAKQTLPKEWTAETTAKIQATLPEATARWQAVQEASFPAIDYGFSDERHQKMQQLIAAEAQALQALKNALSQETAIPQLRATALGIKPSFAGLFKLFGNLEAYQKTQ